MLPAMHHHRVFLKDARSDRICALHFFRPHATCPDTPVLELVSSRLVAAMVNGHARGIAHQNDVVRLPENGIETIHLFVRVRNDALESLPADSQLTFGEYVRGGAVARI